MVGVGQESSLYMTGIGYRYLTSQPLYQIPC